MVVVWTYSLVLVAVAVLLVQRLVVSRRPAWRRRRVDRLARCADLPAVPVGEAGQTPDALVRRVGARVARREVGSLVGGVLGIAAALVLVATGSELDRRGVQVSGAGEEGFALELSMLPALGLLLVVVGQQLGVLVVAGREAFLAPALEGRRLARATTPLLRDYVPRLETTLSCLLCGGPFVLVLVLGAVTLVSPAGPPAGYPVLLVLTAASLGLWAVVQVVSRRVVSQAQVASSPLELAWDDVLRARVLRDLVQVPVLLGVLAAGVLAVVALPELLRPADLGRAVERVALVTGLLAPTAVLLALLLSLLVRPAERYVRGRLWPRPEAAPGAP